MRYSKSKSTIFVSIHNPSSEIAQTVVTPLRCYSALSWTALLLSIVVHLSFLVSLFSEPWVLQHNINLSGSRSHPIEQPAHQGFWDPFFHDTDRVPRGLDFFSIYQAGYNFRHGMSVYYGVREHRYGSEHLVVPYFSGFRYLPYYAVLYGGLLSMAAPWTAYWLWVVFVEILLIFNLHAIRILFIDEKLLRLTRAVWLSFSPYYIEMHIGQQSMVTVTLLTMCAIAHRESRPYKRDFFYGLSVLWKLNSILFIPIWIKLRRFRSIMVLMLVMVILSAPYFLVVPGSFSEFASYFHHKFVAAGPNSQGFTALFVSIWQDTGLSATDLPIALSIWKYLMIGLAVATTFLPKRINVLRVLAMWICIYFLTYQYVWEHHYVMMLPVYTMLVASSGRVRWLIPALFHIAPTPYFFFNDPTRSMPQETWSVFQDLLYYGFRTAPVAIIFFTLVWSEFRFPEPDHKISDPE